MRNALLAVALFPALCAAAAGEDSLTREERERDEKLFPLSGAMVNDNRQAAENFDRVTALIQKGQHKEAVRRLVELQDQYSDKLVLFGSAGQYVSVRRLVQRVAREMPAEALAIYRAAIDPRVDGVLDRPARTDDLRRVLRDYPMATRASEAYGRLARGLWEAGDIEGTVTVLESLLDEPEGNSADAELVVLLAFARAETRDREGIEELEKRFEKRLAEKVMVRGRKVTLKQAIDTARSTIRTPDETAPVWAQWSTWCGDATRNRTACGLPSLPPFTETFLLPPGATHTDQDRGFGRTNAWRYDSPEFLPVFPAVSDGLVVVNTGNAAWARDLVAPGRAPLWEIAGASGSEVLFEERTIHTATISGGRAYFSIAHSVQSEERKLGWLTVVYSIPYRRLYCVDARTGRQIWHAGGDATVGKQWLEHASFQGAPLLDGGRLYCGVTYWARPTDPVEHHLVCLDAETGALLWKEFVASGIQEINLFGNNTREAVGSSLTLWNDRLFYCTNMGVVICADRSDGKLLWARRYPRFQVNPVTDPYDVPRQPVGWMNNPILVAVEPHTRTPMVYVTPMDSPKLLALSATDGTEKWRYDRNEDGAGLRHLIGIRKNSIYLSGRTAMKINLDGSRAWRPYHLGAGDPAGRGILGPDYLYIPTTVAICRVGLETPDEGRLNWAWKGGPGTGAAGNLTMVDQSLISTANDSINLYSDADRMRKMYEAEIRKSPGSAYLRYRLALTLLQDGQTEDAEQALRAALNLAEAQTGEQAKAIAAACRQTLFRNRVQAAETRARRDDHRGSAEELEKARTWARTPDAWTELLFALADSWDSAGESAKAVECLQEIIEKHGDVPWNRAGPARDQAVTRIRSILRTDGTRAAYASFEKSAADLLARARKARDPALFEQILARYPNSLAAEEASYGLGAAQLQAGNWEGACDSLSRFLRESPDSKFVPQALAELAIGYEKRQMWGSARGKLTRLKRQYGSEEITVEGGAIQAGVFAEARLKLPAYRAAEREGGPGAVGFPAKAAWKYEIPAGTQARVLSPRGSSAWKKPVAFVLGNSKLTAIDADSGEEKWEAVVPDGVRWASWSGTLLVVAGDQALLGLKENGEPAWRTTVGGTMLYEAQHSDGIVYFSGRRVDGRGSFLSCIDTATGAISWKHNLQDGHHLKEFWVMEDAVAYRWPDDVSGKLVLVDRETGALRQRFNLLASHVQRFSPDRFLAIAPNASVQMIDASTGRTLWTQPNSGMRMQDGLLFNETHIAVTTFEQDSWHLKIIDAVTGKLVKSIDLEVTFHLVLLSDAENIYVIFKDVRDAEAPNRYRAFAYSFASGARLWEVPIDPKFKSLYPCVDSKDHLILNLPVYDKVARQFTPTMIGLDKKTGKESGRIEARPGPQVGAYAVDVVPGRLIVTQEDVVEAFGK